MYLTPEDWEEAWAPYSEEEYQAVLRHLRPEDVVLDIGAGDLRLARRMAARVRRVWAVERRAEVVARGLSQGPLPSNLEVVVTDARTWPFPPTVTVGVLLMRHCRHFRLYRDKLAAVGARGLLTNARWGMGVERVDLQAPALPFAQAPVGWYACRCGSVGFIPGPPEALTPAVLEQVSEVASCPHCEAEVEQLLSVKRGGARQVPVCS